MRRWFDNSWFQVPAERERYPPETRSQIATHRLLCLLGAGLVPAFGVLYSWSYPEAVDPLWARFVLAGLFGGLLSASVWSDHVRENYALWMRAVLYLLMAWFAALAAFNRFTGGYVLGLLVTYSVLIAIAGVGARSLTPVFRFEAGGLLFTATGLAFAPATETSTLLLVSSMVAVAIVQTIAMQGQIATRETLRFRNAHLRGIANSVPGVVFQFARREDHTYGFNFVSDQARDRLGLRPEDDDIFKRFLERIPVPNRQEVAASIDNALEAEEGWRREIPFRGESQEPIWLLGVATPETLDGAVVYNGVALDITARKQAETQARLQSQVMDQVMRGVPFRQILADLVRHIEEERPEIKGSILLYNESERCLRNGAAPSLPDAYIRGIDGVEVGPNAGSCGAAVYTDAPVIVEDILEDPRWADYRDLALEHGLRACWSVPFRDSNGEVVGTFALYYTEPKAPNEADRRLINRARSLASLAVERHRDAEELRLVSAAVRQSTDGVAIVENDRGEHFPGPILYVNEAFTRITGYGEDDVIGSSMDILHGPDTEPWVVQRLRDCLKDGEEFEGEALLYQKDGTPFVSRATITPVQDDRGEITHWVCVQRDVTEAQQTGERMLAVHDEERRRIDRDIRQEMGGLLATLQMTLDAVRGELEERDVPTDRIQEVESLVQEVAVVARSISDRLHPTPLVDHGLTQILPSLLKRIEERHGLDVNFEVDVESEGEIGSLVQMIAFHVVQEALRNVVQHAGTDGAEVVVRQGTREVHIDIIDDGDGFDPAKAEPDETYGLFGMKKRVERLNGEIEIDAAPGEGTHISVTLPQTTTFEDSSDE